MTNIMMNIFLSLSLSLWNRAGRGRGGSKELIGRSDRFDYFSFLEFNVTDLLDLLLY